ncbi:hypothetical protein [Mesorhizobium sp. M1378]|uniref:hypothetical protein n=1 Tax=Mesorhizobium sp. M1378 TaxID=2957092 RepID=UPI003335E971
MTPFFAARQDRLLLMLIRTVALIGAFALAGLLPAIPQAHAQDAANWTGVWDTKWRGGGAQIKFEQTGADVKGVYPLYNGRIEAKADGDKLVGHWFEGDRQGAFTFVQSPDGGSFMGRFDAATAEWWTGVRVSAVEDVRVDQSSPMSTMRSFLQTMNESGADNVPRATGGGMGLAGLAAGLVDVTETDRGGLNMPDYTKLLFTVVDNATFRLWSLPHDTIAGDEVTATLPQYGTRSPSTSLFAARMATGSSSGRHLPSSRPSSPNSRKRVAKLSTWSTIRASWPRRAIRSRYC